MPEAGADGFIVPLEEPLPEAGDNGFIAPIEAPDPNATVIHTAEELAAIKSGSYVLANDIYLDEYNGGVWIPITPTGEVTLDGQGHKIYNMYISENASMQYAGLFGYCKTSVSIKNIGIEDCDITASSYVGGLVGYGYSSVAINNSYNTSDVNTESDSSESYVGGLVGYGNYRDITISNSYNTGDVRSNSYAGGLIGYRYDGTTSISNSYNTGDVRSSESYVGGLVGYGKYGDITISNSYNTGDVRSNSCAGGLIGYRYDGTTGISNSYNTGDIMSSNSCAGGLVGYGYSSITISNSYNTGDVSGSGYAGGLVGLAGRAIISSSYNTGNVRSNSYVGGLVGYGNAFATISKSYNAGVVSTENGNSLSCASGGVMGYAQRGADISNSYNIGGVSAKGVSQSCAGGLVGYGALGEHITISDSYNTGDVSAIVNGRDSSHAGGLIGYIFSTGTISNSYNTGDVSAKGVNQSYAGGLVGSYSSTVSNSYNTGSVHSYTSNYFGGSYARAFAGGLIGEGSLTIDNSYNTGHYTAVAYANSGMWWEEEYSGPIVGKGTVTYADIETPTETTLTISKKADPGEDCLKLNNNNMLSVSASFASSTCTADDVEWELSNDLAYISGTYSISNTAGNGAMISVNVFPNEDGRVGDVVLTGTTPDGVSDSCTIRVTNEINITDEYPKTGSIDISIWDSKLLAEPEIVDDMHIRINRENYCTFKLDCKEQIELSAVPEVYICEYDKPENVVMKCYIEKNENETNSFKIIPYEQTSIPDSTKLFVKIPESAFIIPSGYKFNEINRDNKDDWYFKTEAGLIYGRDMFIFSNSPDNFLNDNEKKYVLSDKAKDTLFSMCSGVADKAMMSIKMNEKWGGACFGMAVMTVLNDIGLTSEGNGNLYQLSQPKTDESDSFTLSLRDKLHIYYLSQKLSGFPIYKAFKVSSFPSALGNVLQSDYSYTDMLKKIVDRANRISSQGTFVLNFGWSEGIKLAEHSVVVNRMHTAADGSYLLEIYDNNYPPGMYGNNSIVLKIKSDYSDCYFVGVNGIDPLYNSVCYIGYAEGKEIYDFLYNKGSVDKLLTTRVYVNPEDSIKITSGENTVTFDGDNGFNYDGTVVVYLENNSDGSEVSRYAVEFPTNEDVEITPLSSSCNTEIVSPDFYAYIDSANVTKAVYSNNNRNVDISGENINGSVVVCTDGSDVDLLEINMDGNNTMRVSQDGKNINVQSDKSSTVSEYYNADIKNIYECEPDATLYTDLDISGCSISINNSVYDSESKELKIEALTNIPEIMTGSKTIAAAVYNKRGKLVAVTLQTVEQYGISTSELLVPLAQIGQGYECKLMLWDNTESMMPLAAYKAQDL
ncbi:MAG: GLUG motif-containing protein [Candidatus Ornithomonoglobus sp.]